MRPQVEITVDGNPVAGFFYSRLESVTVTDNEGVKSDTVDLKLTDGPPDFLALPRTGAIIAVRLGYERLGDLGTYTADKISLTCLPYSMSISGKAADLRSGKLKERQERAWSETSLGAILGEIARESGLTLAMDEEFADIDYVWVGQLDETNLHFVQRLAVRHNALYSVKAGRLVFSRKGGGVSASGQPLGSVIVTPDIVITGTLNAEINDRTKYSKVVSYYQDKGKAERVEIEADGNADGDSVYRIPEPFASPDEADKAAKAKAKELKRGEGNVSVSVVGDPSICAGASLLFINIRPGLDGVPYIVKTATHRYSKTGGYITDISGKLYDGKSADEGKPSSEPGSGSGSDAKPVDKVAPNSAPGTPATPSAFLQPRRYGRTDEN